MFNKSVLITGCDSGIGFNLCKQLIERGFYIIAICKTEAGKKNVETVFFNFKNKQNTTNIDEINKCKLSNTLTEDIGIARILDILCEESIKQLYLTYNELNKTNKVPNLYAIINNAALWRFSSFEESCLNETKIHQELERWKSVLNTNVLGSVSICLHFFSCLRPFGALKPRIIFISSVLDECAMPGQCSYISSKFAIKGFHESLLHELSKNDIFSIRISPGAVRNTNLFDDLEDYEVDQSYKYKHTKEIKDGLRKLLKFGSSTDGVARTVICALESKRPRTHYRNTRGTFVFRVAKFLPKFVFIRIVRFVLTNNFILENKLVQIALKYIFH